MAASFTVKPTNDPEYLIHEAEGVLAVPSTDAPAQRSSLEEDIRHAYRVVSADLVKIQALAEKESEIPYAEIFGALLHDKLAAITFLAKHKLYDVNYAAPNALETIEARRDLSGLVEILFKMHAVDGLKMLYDFSAQQQTLHDPHIWQSVSLYYLRLIAMMPEEAHSRVIAFLKERPNARRQVEQQMVSADPLVATLFRGLGEIYVRVRNDFQELDDLAINSLYARLYYQYDPAPPNEHTLGLTMLLATETRLNMAVRAGDLTTIVRWVTDGSPAMARLAFQLARNGLSVWAYAAVLGQILQRKELPAVILVAAVLELGALNRRRNTDTGEAEINSLLVDFALCSNPNLTAAARIAVRQLGDVQATHEVVTVIEKAPIIEVAEEGILALRDLRCLPLADTIVQRRPILTVAMRSAVHYLQDVQTQAAAVWAAQSLDAAAPYLERLKALKALPELEEIGKRHQYAQEWAKGALDELRGPKTGGKS